jgi:hypothetical protein
MTGLIKNGTLQAPAAERRADEAAAKPKKRAATWGDTKKALKGGHIDAEQAADLSPSKMKPAVTKAKKKK